MNLEKYLAQARPIEGSRPSGLAEARVRVRVRVKG
jgi:hypothetical protein